MLSSKNPLISEGYMGGGEVARHEPFQTWIAMLLHSPTKINLRWIKKNTY